MSAQPRFLPRQAQTERTNDMVYFLVSDIIFFFFVSDKFPLLNLCSDPFWQLLIHFRAFSFQTLHTSLEELE